MGVTRSETGGAGRPLFAAALAVATGAALAGAGAAGGLALAVLASALVLFGERLGVARGRAWILVAVLAFLRALGPGQAEPEVPATWRALSEVERLQLEPRLAVWQTSGASGVLRWSRDARVRWRASAPAAGSLEGERAQLAFAGERVLLLPGTPPMLRAEGLVDGEWAASGIMGSLRVEPDALVRLAPARRTALGWLAHWLQIPSPRAALIEATYRIEASAGGRLPRGLLAALLFGDKRGLEFETRDLFTRTGTRHLLAISGLHVGLLAAFLLQPLARGAARLLALLSRGRVEARRAELPLLLGGLLIFVPLTGASPPVVRASVVIALALGAGRCGRLGRRFDPLNLWGAALLLELLFATRPLTSLSLQLSYLATLGLMLGLGPLGRALTRRALRVIALVPGAEVWRPGWARARWTAPLFALARWLPVAVAASLSAVLATLPIAWSTFGELAPIGILLTPLAVLPLAWLLTLGWPLVLGVALTGKLAQSAGTLLAPAAEQLTALFRWADGLPGTPLALPARPTWLLWLPLLAIGAALLVRRDRTRPNSSARLRGSLWLEATAALAAGCLLLPWSATPPRPELVLLDVGHGTAALLRLETGAVWLFDGGTRDRTGLWRQALAPQLAAWDAGPPHVILTHGDRDHWSALEALVTRRPPVLWAGHRQAELELLLPAAIDTFDLERGAIELPSGRTRLTLLRGGDLPGNEGSRALLIDAPGLGRVLLSGDAEAAGLAAMLEHPSLATGAPLDVLLLPHHGSESDPLAELLDVTRPRAIWVSTSGQAQLEPELERLGLEPRITDRLGPLSWPPHARIRRPPHKTFTPAPESVETPRSRSSSLHVHG